MNLNDFLYVLTIAELGNYTKAAKQLFVTQPTLSLRVKQIENAYGITIFNREASGIRLTREGECFVRYANQFMTCEKNLRREIDDMQNRGKQTLLIGTTPHLAQSALFDKLILRYHARHPDVKFEFIEGPSTQLEQLLLSDQIDIAIGYQPVESPELDCTAIFDDRLVMVPAHGSPLAKKLLEQSSAHNYNADIALLAGEAFALPPSSTRLYHMIQSMLGENDITLDIRHSGNFSMIYSMAKAGITSALLPESFLDPTQEHEPYYYITGRDGKDCAEPLSIAVAWKRDAYLRIPAKELVEIAQDMHAKNEIHLRIGVSNATGTYYSFATATTNLYNRYSGGWTMAPVINHSGTESYEKMLAGEVDTAAPGGLALASAWEGKHGWEDRPIKNQRIWTVTFADWWHIIVPASSPVNTLSDLKGKRISLGAKGGGETISSLRLLCDLGFSEPEDVFEINYLSAADSILALQDGSLDAFFYMVGIGNKLVAQMARSPVGLKLISLTETEISSILTRDHFAKNRTIHAGSYKGISYDVKTVGDTACMVSLDTVPDEVVYEYVKMVNENQSRLSSMDWKFTGATAEETVRDYYGILPFHPGAERYYRELGLIE